MWARLLDHLVCPCSGEPLTLVPLEQRAVALESAWQPRLVALGIEPASAARWIETGLLCAKQARLWFPISHGLPILLPYRAAPHDEFVSRHGAAVARLCPGYRLPAGEPAPGEQLVLRSFSTEWRDYDDSEVLWTCSVEERHAFFRDEIGADELTGREQSFVEIGCGLGLVTALAASELGVEALGVDLSLAAMRAANRYCDNPLANFIQASLWALPLRCSSFDIVYSHGVLHHTHDPEAAFARVAALARPEGRTYAWLYGPGRARASLLRRLAFPLEQAARPLLARLPTRLANLFLYPLSLAYWLLNSWQSSRRSLRQPYDLARALHAARDRFTTAFAHIQRSQDVQRWFENAGFSDLHLLRPDEVGPASRGSVALNVAMRGIRAWRQVATHPGTALAEEATRFAGVTGAGRRPPRGQA